MKHDGYRMMLVIERAMLYYTRNGHDWSDRYPGIIATARKLPCRNAILDGEVIVQDGCGVSDFEALQAEEIDYCRARNCSWRSCETANFGARGVMAVAFLGQIAESAILIS